MTQKPVLFLDTSWLSDACGRQSQNPARFKKILDALNENYDLKITDRVYEESVTDTSYPKDAALKEWLEDNRIEKIVTETPPGRDAGEISIIETIKKNPAYAQAKIASHDLNFFSPKDAGKGGHAFAKQTVSVQSALADLVLKNKLPEDVYCDLSKKGSPNLRGGWKTVEQLRRSLPNFSARQEKSENPPQKPHSRKQMRKKR